MTYGLRWQPIDCHAHTTFSDGDLTVAELVEHVQARGVRPSVADHLSVDVRSSVKTPAAVRAYLDELSMFDVARGGEFCWHDTLWRELPDELTRRFTHRLGSLHSVFLPGSTRTMNLFSRTVPDGLTPDAYMDIHLDNLERLTREMPMDILAHPTLMPIPYRRIPLEELWTEEREERAVNALADAGMALEVSSRYRPHQRLVRRAHEQGVRLALGSDGHGAEQVGNIAFSLVMVQEIGVAPEELFDPFVHGRGARSKARAH